jgi:hypothetical protein
MFNLCLLLAAEVLVITRLLAELGLERQLEGMTQNDVSFPS